jgi:hypothetical protein
LKKVKAPAAAPNAESASALEEKKEAEIKDVQREARHEHRTERLLGTEGIQQSNRREGLRERRPDSQLVHSRYGVVKW